MRWPWKCDGGRTARPLSVVNPKRLELETAKEILAEVFRARPEDVEEMIQKRLEERSLAFEQGPLPEDRLWPATFCLGE